MVNKDMLYNDIHVKVYPKPCELLIHQWLEINWTQSTVLFDLGQGPAKRQATPQGVLQTWLQTPAPANYTNNPGAPVYKCYAFQTYLKIPGHTFNLWKIITGNYR